MTLTFLESQTGILCPLSAVLDELFLQISLMLVSLSNQSLHTCASRVGGGGRGGKWEERGKRCRVKNVYQIFWVSWSLDLSFFAKLSHNLKFVVEILKKTLACG